MPAFVGWAGVGSLHARVDASEAAGGAAPSESPDSDAAAVHGARGLDDAEGAVLAQSPDSDSGPGGAEQRETPERGDAAGGGPWLVGLLCVGSRLLSYVGIVGLIGSLAFRVLVLSPMSRAGEFSDVLMLALGRTWQIAMTSCSAALAAVPLRLCVQVWTYFPDDPVRGVGLATSQTAWGGGWWLHVGGGILAAVGLIRARPLGRRTIGWVVAAAGILLLPLGVAVSGNAWAAEPRGLAVASLYLHVVAGSVWLGGLFCMFVAGIPALMAREVSTSDGYVFPGAFHGLPAMVGAFARIAVVAVALVLATGTTSAWLRLDDFSQLWSTPWGRSLLSKTVAVALMMGLGFYNWRVVRPALDGSRRPALLKGPMTMEVALGAGVLVATSSLVVRSLS